MTTIPTDTARVLLVTAGGECALFVDGERQALGDPIRQNWNMIELCPAVYALAHLADVRIVQDVDRRVLVEIDEDGDPIWRETLTSVLSRQAELDEAKVLRTVAAQKMAEADQLEANR